MKPLNNHHQLYEELASVVGPENVSDDKFACWAVSRDASFEPAVVPGIVVLPKDTEEVSLILKLCNKYKVPITIRGGGTGVCGACIPYKPNSVVLDTTRMNKIFEVNKQTMVATAQAGATFGRLMYEVEKADLSCCPGPHVPYSATIGGFVSTTGFPIGGARFGAYGEEVVCLEVVLPTGEVIRTGSDATINSGRFTRYGNGPDLTGMFIGDHGLFGVKTEVSVRLHPKEGKKEFETYCFKDIKTGINVLQKMAQSELLYAGFAVLGKHSVQRLRFKHPEIPPESEMVNMVCIEGDEDTLKIKKRKLDSIAEGSKVVGPEPAKLSTYDIIGEHACKVRSTGVSAVANGFTPIYKLPELVNLTTKVITQFEDLIVTEPNTNLKAWLLTAWPMKGGYVNSAIRISFKEHPPEIYKKAYEVWHKIVDLWCEKGNVPYWIGKTWTPHIIPRYREEYYRFLKKLKRMVDPNNILNPGLLGMTEDGSKQG
jgi:glycolate oxidase